MRAIAYTLLAFSAMTVMSADAPKFPTVKGRYQMTDNWSIELKEDHKQRFEDGSLVLWRPGMTSWIVVYNAKPGTTREDALKWRKRDADKNRTQEFEASDDKHLRWAYLLFEKTKEDERWALYSFTFGKDSGHVQMATYFDDRKDLEKAKQLWMSLQQSEKKIGEPDGPAKGSQPIRSETNRTSSTAGSRR
jgi:dihydroorotase-like cyclic amidohydrolase